MQESRLRIRAASGPAEYPRLVEIWKSSVAATHDFLEELTVAELEGIPVAFAGTADGKLEMLFVDHEHRGLGVGSALLAWVIDRHGIDSVDVNEQNTQAVQFYSHRGFVVAGRSEHDEAGRPYPLLHLTRAEVSPCIPTS